MIFINIIISLCFFSCTEPNHQKELDIIDFTLSVADPPEGGYQFASPIIEVEPFTEVNLCYYGTYNGPTVGVNYMTPFAPAGITHHASLMAVYDDEFEDGALIDCIEQGDNNMPIYSPLFEAVGIQADGGEPFEIDPFGGLNWIDVPEGIAFKLESGQRWVLDLHFINTHEQRAIVNSAFNVGIIPEIDVVYWASTLQFDAGPIELQPGRVQDSFSCPFENEFTILSIMGHMHSFGSYYGVEWNMLDQTEELVYSVDNWTPAYKDYPKITYYEPGEIIVQPQDSFKTYCDWNNTSQNVITSPGEMCTTVIVAYPMEKPMTCVRGNYVDY